MSNHSNKPLPTFSGATLPLNIVVDNHDDDDTGVTRRAAGAVVFNEPLLRSTDNGPAKSNSTDMRPSISQKASMMPSKTTKHQMPVVLAPRITSWRDTLAGGDISALPAFLPLEQTAVFVPNVAYVTLVAERIDAVLRELSIEASFDGPKATCTTLEGVEFCIRLYRGRGKLHHGIIVEVQRRFGTSLRFHKDTLAILHAAQGKKPRTPNTTSNYLPPAVVSDTEDDDVQMRDGGRRNSSTLDLVSKMFQHPGTYRLALTTLATFTSPAKIGASTARTVSCQLLEPGNSVGAKVVSLIILDSTEKELRVMAMEALANALEAAQQVSSCLPVDKLRSVLHQDLVKCDQNLRAAFMAARCLEPLLDSNHDDEQLYQALFKASTVGQAKHAALARQVLRCQDRFAKKGPAAQW